MANRSAADVHDVIAGAEYLAKHPAQAALLAVIVGYNRGGTTPTKAQVCATVERGSKTSRLTLTRHYQLIDVLIGEGMVDSTESVLGHALRCSDYGAASLNMLAQTATGTIVAGRG